MKQEIFISSSDRAVTAILVLSAIMNKEADRTLSHSRTPQYQDWCT